MNKGVLKQASKQRYFGAHQDVYNPVKWLGIMVFVLLTAPKLRIMVGPAPLYAVDGLIVFLFLSSNHLSVVKWSSLDSSLSKLVSCYLFFIWLGELHGLVIYGAALESIFIIMEFSLAISLFFTVPKMINSEASAAFVLKGIVAGLVFTSIVTIMYSLSPTRPWVVKIFFSRDFLVPSAEKLAQHLLIGPTTGDALRGSSLIGTSTITTGFLGTMWVFAFLAAQWPGIHGKWRNLAQAAAVLTPVAMLMTYGRAAWLTVIILGAMSFGLGFAKSRRYVVILVIALAIIIYRVGWQSELFMVDRVVNKTQQAVENPYEEESFAYRLNSFTQPFSHLLKHPIWLIIGAGRVGQKLSHRGNFEAKLLDDAGLSKHSGFGMAYYCYGLLAAITNCLIMFSGFRFIMARVKTVQQENASLYKITWQALLMAWVGLLCWWLPGHAMIGEARGVILFFFFFGFMMAMDRVFILHGKPKDVQW